MMYNNLIVLEGVERLLAEIVVYFATIAWKTQIFLHKVVQITTLTGTSKRICKHIRLRRSFMCSSMTI